MLTVIRHADIATRDEILLNHQLWIRDELIEAIKEEESPIPEGAEVVDAMGDLVMPGMIDIHSDMIERTISPRKNTTMDYEFSLRAAERELISQGITTMYHSISLYNPANMQNPNNVRLPENALRFARLLERFRKEPHIVHHRFHMRYEIDNLMSFDLAKEMIRHQLVDLFSFMDHRPGQGQYHDLDRYFKMHSGKTPEEMEAILKRHREKEVLTSEMKLELANLAAEYGISVASHDDDCISKLEENLNYHTVISEFPITLEVARAARRMGYEVSVGAPNVLMGGSHVGNLSSAEAILDGCATVLVSDYYTNGMLEAVFMLQRKYGLKLHDAIAMVTHNPARAVGVSSYVGSIEPGKVADLLIVNHEDEHPMVRIAFVNGEIVLMYKYIEKRTKWNQESVMNRSLA